MKSILCPIATFASISPKKAAVIENGKVWSYQKLHEHVGKISFALEDIGVSSQEKVSFVTENTAESVAIFFALFRLEAIACPISHRMSQDAIEYYQKSLGPSFYLKAPLPPSSKRKSNVELSMDSPSLFLATSGTSNKPKIAALSFGNLYYSALGSIEALKLEKNDRTLLSLPLFHVSGISQVLRVFISGSTLVISNQEMVSAIMKEKITHLSCVPMQLARFSKTPSHLKCLLLGGSPIPLSIWNEYKQSLPLFPTYGMTEMASTITINTEKDKKNFHLGKPILFRDVILSNESEILVKGKTLFLGYFENGKISISLDDNGFFATRDLGEIINGNLIWKARKDLMFVSGGENIQPEEIEGHLNEINGIQQAIIVPMPDEEYGMICVAFIQTDLSVEFIKAKLLETLPRYKIPKHFFPMPETSVLKPSRNEFSALARAYAGTYRK